MLLRAWLTCLLLVGCGGPGDTLPRRAHGGLVRNATELARRPRPPVPPEKPAREPAPAAADCEAEWARVAALPALDGTPKLDPERAEAVARAKGEPVIFVRAPSYTPSKDGIVRGYRRALTSSRFPWDTLTKIDDRFHFAPRVGREVLLRDGYLYADTADLAWALWDRIKLDHLFDEPEIVIERGSSEIHVRRDPEKGYRYLDGPDAGQAARLLLFDRVRVAGEPRKPPLHRDVRSLAHHLGFERMKLVRLTDTRILAELRYGDVWVRSVLASDGARVTLACELPPVNARAELERVRTRAAVRERVVSSLRVAMLAAVAEELPFDEPKTEWGQQDGHLRNHWEKAYAKAEDSYFFQGDRYQVFDRDGHPLAPEVCIDFVTETLERASGTWWRPRGETPGRSVGGIDFDALLDANRRQVTSFINYTKTHPDEFVHELVPETRRIPYQFKHQFYRRLAREADHYAAGDIVIIRGLAPWDHYNVPHFHSFFVYENDPVTGVPILLAGNAGKPRVQSWSSVMERAPGRSINYRIRPKLEWLASAIPDSGNPAPRAAPPLVAMF